MRQTVVDTSPDAAAYWQRYGSIVACVLVVVMGASLLEMGESTLNLMLYTD